MPDLEKLYPGRFIKAVSMTGPVTVTIADVQPEKVKNPKTHKDDDLAVVYLVETERDWNLCKTNALCIAAITGTRDYKQWVGHRITIFSEPTENKLAEYGVQIRVMGSPELTEPVKVKIPNPGPGDPAVRTMQPTGSQAVTDPSLLDGGDEE